MINIRRLLVACASVAAILTQFSLAADSPAGRAQSAVFAVIDGVTIGIDEFEGTMNAAISQKFYHRRPPEDQLAALREEVTERIVNQVLLLKEAQRRGLQPEEEKVRAQIAAYEMRNRDRPQWEESRTQILPALTRALRDQSVIAQLAAATRAVSPPREETLYEYYKAHAESFTEPERFRLSMILLKVDPSSPGTAWQQALDRAHQLFEELTNGADFADLARLHSDDTSAPDGGDMGYRHRGMLPPGVESEIEKMAVGGLSQPIRLLEGVAILRITERRQAQLRRLEDVRRNVGELWAREQAETQWRELLGSLRAKAEIRISHDSSAGPVGGGSQTAR